MATFKDYVYKIYTADDVFIGVWNDVISDFSISEEINTAGSQVAVVLGRPADEFGEGLDVDFDLIVRIYAVDADDINGTPVFTGYISSYTPKFGDSEAVQVNILGFGSKLDELLIQAGEAIDQQQTGEPTGFNVQYNYPAAEYVRGEAQTFVIGSTGYLSRIELKCCYFGTPTTATVILRTGTPPSSVTRGYDNEGTYVAIASASVASEYPAAEVTSFVFSTPVEVVAGDTYYFEVQCTDQNQVPGYPGYYPQVNVASNSAGGYANGQEYYVDKGNVNTGGMTYYTARTGYDLWFKTYLSTGSTTAAYLSDDPSDILRSIIDDYNNRGGELTYDLSSIDDTGTTVSYTFNTNTVWEGMKKCLELAPAGWYLYIDQATNLVYFKQKADTVEQNITLGKDVIELSPEKRTEDIVNTVYFTGGGDPPLFELYTSPDSILLYGERVKRYVDQRVTVSATAEAIATSILEERNAPELRLNVTVADNNGDATKGLDIETLVIGQTIGIRNVEGNGPTLWDVAYWDVDYWDYNIQDLSSPILQIVRLERSADKCSIFCSTVPPDVSKRIEDINRNLEATQTKDNPAVAA